MLYELSLISLGFLLGIGFFLYMGWRWSKQDAKKHPNRDFIFLTIEGNNVSWEEREKLKGVDEIDKTGLGKEDLERKR